MQEKISSLSAYVSGCAFALFGAYSLQDWMSIIGGVCVVFTALVNRYYKKKMLEEIRKRPISEKLYEEISD
ncbi:HP1 family phage holin [Aliivibrio sp. S4TY2]|uniref:HP1 family phage holin n=1 Tax=unclassified Aliivibrio TaxID=2645654 RepID=UPI002379E864|nr:MULTISPECIES: HP1 family phage holin [unclassified Aliivibrio]MDD9156987.1 HP1 family phage holin [Aliivibrio sp. S4TY2]MDD9160799.1 HP1 family phage holin [Aliivibrio sp. S4TY1]MDD9164828.1 HP1 family phage holin [Aliivibrio sp. S4MY2]MDD9168897.1 HP1 family phage holin [Aliivibrio sp. S4MY4]MDD9185425.1 HP1 family phage holin [Aliivibrio sp. S4MY3]